MKNLDFSFVWFNYFKTWQCYSFGNNENEELLKSAKSVSESGNFNCYP